MIVGGVIFLIITVVQFMVITKGAAITALNIMDTSNITFSGFIHGATVGNTLWSNLFIDYYL